MLKLERPWTRQPQGVDGVDVSHPLSQGLQFAFSGANPTAPLLPRSPAPSLNGTSTTAYTRLGRGPWLNGQSVRTNSRFTSANGTLILLLDVVAAPGPNDVIFAQNAAADGNIGLGWQAGGVYLGGSVAAAGAPTVGLHALTVTWGAGGIKTYIDGVAGGTNASTAPPTANAADNGTLEIGCFSYSGGRIFYTNIIPLFFGVWDRELSSSALRAVEQNPWQLFAPRRIYIPTAAAAGGSLTSTGALSAQAATVAGTAAHYTLHASTGALSAQAATLAGTAAHVHATTGALSAQAATVAGTAAHYTLHTSTGALAAAEAAVAGTADHSIPGTNDATGALSAQEATVAGTAAHYTLHTSTGALQADAATVAGTASHLTLHTATGALVADAAAVSGSAIDESTYVPPTPQTGGGRPARKQRKRQIQVEIDGEVINVESIEEAEEVLAKAAEQATETAKLAIERAAKAKRRPVRKIVRDAEKALAVPEISVPPSLRSYADQMIGRIRAEYQSAISAIEIAAHMAKREREIEEDDEEVMMLL